VTFVPAHRFIGPATAKELVFVLHGALGSSQNWISFAKALADRTPDVRYVLVDLRGHGASLSAPAPHGLTAAAGDLVALADDLGQQPRAVIGHSLGGKVALEYGRLLPDAVEQIWCLDSNPAAQVGAERAHDVFRVLAHVRAVSARPASRAAAIEELERRGVPTTMARWLGTSLRAELGRYRWTYDFECVEALLHDYFARDLWDYVNAARERPVVHLVVAERSDQWTPGFRERAVALGAKSSVVSHLLRDAGHWVHVDNPSGLLAMIAPELATG
jgi:esterase